MNDDYPQVACSLTTRDAAGQGLEWVDLQRHALTSERIDGGAAMTFDADLADRVEDLAARERACCGFLSIGTARSGGELRLEITTNNPAARPIIESMAGLGSR